MKVFVLSICFITSSVFACIPTVGEFTFTSVNLLQVKEKHNLLINDPNSITQIALLKSKGYICKRVTNRNTLCHKFLTDEAIPLAMEQKIKSKFKNKKMVIEESSQDDEVIIANELFKSSKIYSKAQYSEIRYDYYLLNTMLTRDSSFSKMVFYNNDSSEAKNEFVLRCDGLTKTISKQKKVSETVWRSYLMEAVFE